MFRNGLQPSHIIILLLVILLIFGASKLPDIAKSVGQSLKVFKKEVKELREDDDTSSSYTATGGQPPQTAYPPYPGSQVPPSGAPQTGPYPPAQGTPYPPAQAAPYPPAQDPQAGQNPPQPGQGPTPQH
ncbi:Sec-independent protein translocase subunit TatA [Georgenia ruanii]|uniref:Sec-independent protein translocase protein TatA n=1 Tax=Georgenia ruanii TaxID=348442 RepID=A0A7J9UW24_9MICO|nr:Sec-independent protein translocase subunit TatA [Georgenia ruanii]MPV88692.1 twin-arginine translocase TatA/TatE family subunit [Georgenia ruanii]